MTEMSHISLYRTTIAALKLHRYRLAAVLAEERVRLSGNKRLQVHDLLARACSQ